jgi:catechol 2,3-dioxygenase-like lactoylglutathione lyase family enzyme
VIKGLHHSAYRCSDSEQTRQFYEDFLGLPLVHALSIPDENNPQCMMVLHTFFQMADASCLAFFEVPRMPFDFKAQHDFDLHIALEVPAEELRGWYAKGQQAGIETRGIVDHDFIESVYLRDPDGYVVELASRREYHDDAMNPAMNAARAHLDEWQQLKKTRQN